MPNTGQHGTALEAQIAKLGEMNLTAEMTITALHMKLDELQLRQLEAIDRIDRLLAERAGS